MTQNVVREMTIEEFEALPTPEIKYPFTEAVLAMKPGGVIVIKDGCLNIGECAIRDMLTLIRRDHNVTGDPRSFKDQHLDDGTVAIACFEKVT